MGTNEHDSEPWLPADECSTPDLLRKCAHNLRDGNWTINRGDDAGAWAAVLNARADILQWKLSEKTPADLGSGMAAVESHTKIVLANRLLPVMSSLVTLAAVIFAAGLVRLAWWFFMWAGR